MDDRRFFLILFGFLLKFRFSALSIGLGVCVTPVGGDLRSGLGIISIGRVLDAAEDCGKDSTFVNNEFCARVSRGFRHLGSAAFVFPERNSKMTGIVNIMTTIIAKTIAITFSVLKR